MKKIMFNDKYGLTQAVLEGQKTMTRRIINLCENDLEFMKISDQGEYLFCSKNALDGAFPKYQIGEVVAVAQSYKNINEHLSLMARCVINPYGSPQEHPGWNNKMFVAAGLMPHRIRITDIKVERLQDISEEDCIKEGIEEYYPYIYRNPADKVKSYRFRDKQSKYGYFQLYPVRDCFAVLIDRISGKGTFDRNPYVFVYTFQLII